MQPVEKKFYQSSHFVPGQIKYWKIIPMILITFCSFKFDENSMNLALKYIQTEMGISESVAQWLSSAYFIASAACAVPLSKLANRYGAITVSIYYYLFQGVIRLICYYVDNIGVLIMFKFLDGVFTSGTISTRNGLITQLPPLKEQKASFQKTQILNQIGSIVIPLAAGLVIDNLGWKWSFVVGAMLSLLSAIIMVPIQDPPLQKKTTSFDYFGSLTLMLWVSCFCIACTVLANFQYVAFAIMIVLFVIFLILFLFIEKRHKDAILPLKIMKNPVSDMFFQNILGSCV